MTINSVKRWGGGGGGGGKVCVCVGGGGGQVSPAPLGKTARLEGSL